MRKNHTMIRKALVLAAVLALFAALAATAYAADLFGLRSLLLPPSQPSARTGGPAFSDPDYVPSPYEIEQKDILSLQGYANSPEAMATAEWEAFQNSYDPDGAILAEIGNNPTGLEAEYNNYFVYTQEMADELERILAKYNLKKHTELRILDNYDALCAELSEEGYGFLAGMHAPYTPYIYEDGTFHYDGDVYLDSGTYMYQCTRCMKGTFTDIRLSIGDANDFVEWTYQIYGGTKEDGTSDLGPEVILALGPKVSLVMADLGNSFVTFNILAGTSSDSLSGYILSERDLEIFADSIDWSILQGN